MKCADERNDSYHRNMLGKDWMVPIADYQRDQPVNDRPAVRASKSRRQKVAHPNVPGHRRFHDNTVALAMAKTGTLDGNRNDPS